MARWTGQSPDDVQRVGQLNFDLSEKLGVLSVDPNTKNDDRFRNRLKKQRILNLVQIRVPICTHALAIERSFGHQPRFGND